MTTQLTVDKAGRVVIPKRLRDELHLAAGDTLRLESSGDAITLRPFHEAAPLQKEQGFWVYRTGRSLRDLSIADEIDKGREERQRGLAGLRSSSRPPKSESQAGASTTPCCCAARSRPRRT